MAIKCSLLGHQFTETEVEEERVEEGSEVVITVREVETCERCGKERVVAENKEVTSIAVEGTTGTGPDAADEAAGTPADVGRDDAGPNVDAAEDDAEFVGGGESDGDDAATAGQRDVDVMTDAEQVAGAGGADDVDASDDDAVILDDSETERDPGEWPGDSEDEQATEAEANAAAVAPDASAAAREGADEEWPDEYGYEEESSARADEVDWPEEDEGAGEEWTPTEDLTEGIDGAEVEAAGTASTTTPDGTFACPECGFTTSVEDSSLRAGDFCPDCRRGSLEHRASDETRKE